jgi:hypothetical protein
MSEYIKIIDATIMAIAIFAVIVMLVIVIVCGPDKRSGVERRQDEEAKQWGKSLYL